MPHHSYNEFNSVCTEPLETFESDNPKILLEQSPETDCFAICVYAGHGHLLVSGTSFDCLGLSYSQYDLAGTLLLAAAEESGSRQLSKIKMLQVCCPLSIVCFADCNLQQNDQTAACNCHLALESACHIQT